jgi:hypothetical protein
MWRDDVVPAIFVIIIVGIFMGGIAYEEHTQVECTKYALDKGLSTIEIKSICGIKG